MLFMHVNVLAVLAAAVASMVIGFLWYSPLLFAKPWMLAMGYDPEDKARIAAMQKSGGPKYLVSFLASLLGALVLGKIIFHVVVWTSYQGMKVGFAIWLGFVMTVQLTDKLFADRPWSLFLINTGYQLASCLAMGAILGRWANA
jgi:Protein of unknown function (DUF1761)